MLWAASWKARDQFESKLKHFLKFAPTTPPPVENLMILTIAEDSLVSIGPWC